MLVIKQLDANMFPEHSLVLYRIILTVRSCKYFSRTFFVLSCVILVVNRLDAIIMFPEHSLVLYRIILAVRSCKLIHFYNILCIMLCHSSCL